MNGATADPEVRTINPPSRTSQMIIGKSQNFFRSFINDHKSIKNSPIMPPPVAYHPERENLGCVSLTTAMAVTDVFQNAADHK
jgi:hypothetical protein